MNTIKLNTIGDSPVVVKKGSQVQSQEKTVEITENGTTEVVPDSGYALSKVTVNTNVESSGSAEPEIVYLTEANGMILEVALPGPSYLAKYKNGDNIVIGPIASAAANFAQGTIQVTDFIAVAFFKTEVYFPDGSVMSFDEFISFMTNAGANLIEITKEQFYNLEA